MAGEGRSAITAGIGFAGNIIGNAINSSMAWDAQNEYMQEWGGPEAQMRHFKKAGINPLGISAQLSGAAGDTNVGTQLGTYDLAEAFTNSMNSMLNPAVAANTQSQTASNNADANKTNVEAEGQEIENEVNRETKEDQKRQKIAEANVTEEEARQLQQINDYYPELFDLQKREIEARIRDIDGKIKVYDKQLEQMDQEINESKERIKTMETQRLLNMSEADRAEAEAELAREKKNLTEKEVARQELQNERDREYGAVDPSVQKYLEIRDNEGEDAADKWLDDNEKVIKKMKAAEAEGTEVGTGEGKSTYDPETLTNKDNIAKMQRLADEYNSKADEYDRLKKQRDASPKNSKQYRDLDIQMQKLHGDMESIRGQFDSQYGKMRTNWSYYKGRFSVFQSGRK